MLPIDHQRSVQMRHQCLIIAIQIRHRLMVVLQHRQLRRTVLRQPRHHVIRLLTTAPTLLSIHSRRNAPPPWLQPGQWTRLPIAQLPAEHRSIHPLIAPALRRYRSKHQATARPHCLPLIHAILGLLIIRTRNHLTSIHRLRRVLSHPQYGLCIAQPPQVPLSLTQGP